MTELAYNTLLLASLGGLFALMLCAMEATARFCAWLYRKIQGEQE